VPPLPVSTWGRYLLAPIIALLSFNLAAAADSSRHYVCGVGSFCSVRFGPGERILRMNPDLSPSWTIRVDRNTNDGRDYLLFRPNAPGHGGRMRLVTSSGAYDIYLDVLPKAYGVRFSI
jgi:hypothetical protein